MMSDVVIVGKGPAGLLLASLVLEQGGRVRLIADGQGTLPLWGGQWDFKNYDSAHEPLVDPYGWWESNGGTSRLRDAHLWAKRWSHLRRLWQDVGIPLDASRDTQRNHHIVSPWGHLKPTYLVPAWHYSTQSGAGGVVFVGFPGLVDFPAAAMASVYQWTTGQGAQFVMLEPPAVWRTGWHGLNWAWYLDTDAGRDWLLEEISGRRWPKDAALLFPQILGIDQTEPLIQKIQAVLQQPVGEVPLPPPSAGGLRVARRWERWIRRKGARIVSGHVRDAHGQGVVLGNGRRLLSDYVVLATGGVLGGGLTVEPDARVRNSITGQVVGSLHTEKLGSVGHDDHADGVVPVAGRMLKGWDPDHDGNGGAMILWTVHEVFDALTERKVSGGDDEECGKRSTHV